MPSEGVVHTINHDLRSFYWVLVCVILQHTNHAHPSSDDALLSISPAADDTKCRASKQLWLKFGVKKLTIHHNQPLTDLILQLSRTIAEGHYLEDALDHDMLLRCFEDAHTPDQKWAKDPLSPRPQNEQLFPASNGGPRRSVVTICGSKRKADESPPPPEDAEGAARMYYDDDADAVAARDDETLDAVAPRTWSGQGDQGSDVLRGRF